MRVLKSLVFVFLLGAAAHAQDTTVMVENEIDSVFHADKKTGIVWNDRRVPDSTLQRLRHDEAFWYANAELKKKKEETTDTSFLQWLFGQRWFSNLIWTIIILSFVSVLFLFLIKSNIALFRKSPKRIGENNVAAVPEDIFTIDYEAALKEALAASDYQSAVRFLYLRTLTILSDKNLIDYKTGATNSDYLLQLQQTPYYAPFKKLTRHFEYAWYGRFQVPPGAYPHIEQEFTTFKQHMGI